MKRNVMVILCVLPNHTNARHNNRKAGRGSFARCRLQYSIVCIIILHYDSKLSPIGMYAARFWVDNNYHDLYIQYTELVTSDLPSTCVRRQQLERKKRERYLVQSDGSAQCSLAGRQLGDRD